MTAARPDAWTPAPQPVSGALLGALTAVTAGPVLFAAVYLVDGATLPGYDSRQDSISALSLSPHGWLQQLDFIALGVITIVTALLWRRLLRGGRAATWYPFMRAVEGVALIGIGLANTDPEPGYPPGAVGVAPFSTVHGIVHFGCLFLIIFGQMGGLFVIAYRFRGDPQWRGWSTLSIVCAILINLLIAAFGVANAHRFPYAGIIERAATNVLTVWEVLVLIRLWRGAPLVLDSADPGRRGTDR